jgi:hypothetical protein
VNLLIRVGNVLADCLAPPVCIPATGACVECVGKWIFVTEMVNAKTLTVSATPLSAIPTQTCVSSALKRTLTPVVLWVAFTSHFYV